MKLYSSPGACSLADHIVLRWTGAPFELELVNRDERRSPAFLALNPAGAVPVFEHDGWVLTQNAAILQYLADSFPQAGLLGDGTPRARAEVNRWLSFLNADVHPAFHPYFGSTAYLGEEAAAQTKEAAGGKLRGFFERLDDQLDGRQWLTGSRSIADPYLYVELRWARQLGLDLSGLDHLDAFRRRMDADPGVRAALAAEGLE
ncbi:MAG TPA: glutathione S-transferase N-terminal domain-containing protein [Luteimonas sp.]|nr:glutathione S-transferase N-terminal domain-containing protein [Luteimonas sp.]